MKKILLVLFAIMVLAASTQSVFAVCSGMPDAFYGTLKINDEGAPVGTQVRAILQGEVKGTYTTTVAGQYGNLVGDDKLYVYGNTDGSDYGFLISFQVFAGGGWVDSGESSPYQCGFVKPLNIDVDFSDADGDGYTFDVDCNDGDNTIYPGASETECNGVDNDCDGLVDEGYISHSTNCGTGACYATGSTSCVSGVVVDSCTAGTPAADDSICNNIDDDCNGATDEDYFVDESCFLPGACAAYNTASSCTGGVETLCSTGTPAENDASCNGVDDDCSGATDEDYVSQPTSCGIGACASTGSTSCVSGSAVDSCTPGTPSPEVCEGSIDENCNGQIDEGCACIPDETRLCQMQEGVCDGLQETCTAGGQWPGCDYSTIPDYDIVDTSCDTLDNDCDGSTDEDYVETPTSCGIGACADTGLLECIDGIEQDSCTAGTPVADDSACNSIDDDCSGATDEDYVPLATSCGIGACASTGSTSCVSGSVADSCIAGSPTSEVCNGLDDNCDGNADEGGVCVECVTNDNCELGYECQTGSCVEIPSHCDLYFPTPLYAEWNLFGFPSCTAMSVTDGLASIEGNYGDVFTLENGEWKNYNPNGPPELNTLDTLSPLQGVYIYMTTEDTLIIV